MLKLLHIDDFFSSAEEVTRLANIAYSLPFQEYDYGSEIPNFNLINPEINDIFSAVLKEPIEIIEARSGCFRIPHRFVHFEDFENPNDWAFAVALEPSTFNLYRHTSGADTALKGYKYNYRNLFEWDYTANILLGPNQCVFYRPWLFHSFDAGLIHTYRLRTKG